jgi:hypothetical protein
MIFLNNKLISLFLLIGIFFIPKEINAQNMKAIDILNNLKIYQNLLDEIALKETVVLKDKEGFIKLVKEVESSYSFITLELRTLTKDKSGSLTDFDEILFCEIKFEIDHKDNVAYKEPLYCADKSRTAEIEKLVQEKLVANKLVWNSTVKNDSYSNKEITEYLNKADEIAEQAYNCANGDNYRPGFFSKISIQEDGIHLEQVNHMNSRSTAHKDNYSLRRLEFLLPFTPREKSYHYDYQIGHLLIAFSDSSSDNNKPCGKAIKEKINESVIRYEKK